jgi:hypothetical protein
MSNKTPKTSKMTKLEEFVWNNQTLSMGELATQLNRDIPSIVRAYDRAKKKNAQRLEVQPLVPLGYASHNTETGETTINTKYKPAQR